MMRFALPTTIVMAAVAGTAQAGFFSFASDSASGAWTFTGSGGGFTDAFDATNPVTLLIDDNNGSLPTLEVSVDFDADVSIVYAGSVPLGGGGDFAHNYIASGTFSFTEVTTGITILSATFENSLFTAEGGESSWYTTAGLQGSDGGAGSVDYTWMGASLPGYGLEPGALGLDEDFSFSLSELNTDGSLPWDGITGAGVELDGNMLPIAQWWSEGSYSGSASVIPTPASMALLGLGGIVIARHRR